MRKDLIPKQLNPQHLEIIGILKGGGWHCSNELPMRDYRKRVSEIRGMFELGYITFTIEKEPCRGRCGRKHKAGVKWLRLSHTKMLSVEQPTVKPEKPRTIENTASQRQDWRKSSDFHRPVYTCCDVAILCYEKRLPIQHKASCKAA